MPKNRVFDIAMPVGLAAVIASISPLARPFYSNQNQYFAHVIGPDSPRLQKDWFINTIDPYPIFTRLAKLIWDAFGFNGIMAAAWMATFIAVYAIFLIAKVHRPEFSNVQLALVTSLIGLTMPLCGYRWSAFTGVADQYLINENNILQPSSFGVLLLLAVPFWYKIVLGQATNMRLTIGIALTLTTVACAVHYTYLIVTMIAAFGVLIATWPRKSWKLTANISLSVFVVGIVTALSNPQMFKLLGSTAGQALAQQRFAFERIPHHTLITNWAKTDLLLAAILLFSAFLLRSKRDLELMRWILVTSSIALVSAIVVLVTKSTQLALLFPWRVTVIVVPVAAVVVFCWFIPKLKANLSTYFLALSLCVTVAMAVMIGIGSGPHGAKRIEAVALVQNAQPEGIGLIPLLEQEVRLNANSAVYVDWKSPPYVGADLVEWWRRIDTVYKFVGNPETICRSSDFASIDWALVKNKAIVPACMKSWNVAESAKSLKLIIRPN